MLPIKKHEIPCLYTAITGRADHFGLFGFKQSAVNWTKVLGVLMLIGGAYLINRKS